MKGLCEICEGGKAGLYAGTCQNSTEYMHYSPFIELNTVLMFVLHSSCSPLRENMDSNASLEASVCMGVNQ